MTRTLNNKKEARAHATRVRILKAAVRLFARQGYHQTTISDLATAIGLTQHVGVLRGLIQNKTPLGCWKQTLKAAPLRFPEAYVARSQQPTALRPMAGVH